MTKSVPPYPAISRFAAGTFGWAMDQLAAGNDVRRWHWPIEVIPPNTMDVADGVWNASKEPFVAIWHVYPLNDIGGMCKGFSSGVVGADNDTYEGFGTDSMGYTPTETDRKATDWQTVAEVTQQQIEYMDARRVSHWPSYETPKRCIEDRVESPMLWIVVSIVVMVILMLLFRRW